MIAALRRLRRICRVLEIDSYISVGHVAGCICVAAMRLGLFFVVLDDLWLLARRSACHRLLLYVRLCRMIAALRRLRRICRVLEIDSHIKCWLCCRVYLCRRYAAWFVFVLVDLWLLAPRRSACHRLLLYVRLCRMIAALRRLRRICRVLEIDSYISVGHVAGCICVAAMRLGLFFWF